MKRHISLLIILFILLASCGKDVVSNAPEYLGFWEGKKDNQAFVIRIDNEGYGRYSAVGDGKMDSAEGNVRIKDDKLIISLRRLTINQAPFEEAGTWKMTINKVTYRLLTRND